MAKLYLTQEEKDAADYLQWDDKALGKMVRHVATLINDSRGEESSLITAAAAICISHVVEKNTDDMTVSFKDMVYKGAEVGEWSLIVRKNK